MLLGFDGPSVIFIMLAIALVLVTLLLMNRVTCLEHENHHLKNIIHDLKVKHGEPLIFG